MNTIDFDMTFERQSDPSGICAIVAYRPWGRHNSRGYARSRERVVDLPSPTTTARCRGRRRNMRSAPGRARASCRHRSLTAACAGSRRRRVPGRPRPRRGGTHKGSSRDERSRRFCWRGNHAIHRKACCGDGAEAVGDSCGTQPAWTSGEWRSAEPSHHQAL
jgi:hypothetical protein